jgi:hypothetical protein
MLYIYNQRSKHVFTLATTSISAKNLRHGDNLIFWIQVLFLMRWRWSCFHVEHNFKIRFRSKIIVTLKLQLWSDSLLKKYSINQQFSYFPLFLRNHHLLQLYFFTFFFAITLSMHICSQCNQQIKI